MSGIYISGFEMPESCAECLNIGWHYVFECRLDDAEDEKRLPTCPLIPVPDHGELIDLRELLKEQLTLSDGDQKVAAVCVRDICLLPAVIPADEQFADKEEPDISCSTCKDKDTCPDAYTPPSEFCNGEKEDEKEQT